MLVLARKLGEEILIGGNIRVKVVGLDNTTVRLGIDAPKEISIARIENGQPVRAKQSYALPKS